MPGLEKIALLSDGIGRSSELPFDRSRCRRLQCVIPIRGLPMKPLPFKTLRARLTVLLVVPVVVIMLAAGVAGFIYARNGMLVQWNRTVALQLERAAHAIEMRLDQPLELMKLFGSSGSAPDPQLLEAIVERLRTLPSVVAVNLTWHTDPAAPTPMRGAMSMRGSMPMRGGRFMRFHRGGFAKISPPVVDEDIGSPIVSLGMILKDDEDTAVGNLDIVLRFDKLVADIAGSGWWHEAPACIVDRATGDMVLTSGSMRGRKRLGGTGNPLELALKKAIAEKSAGTLWGRGQPPERVAGFHALNIFPWSLVVFADGRTILAPVIRFRNGFALGAGLLIVVVFLIIRFNVTGIAGTVRQLSRRAVAVAAGDYGDPIAVNSRDEIGRLADSFNIMISGLRERDMIRNTFGLYVDPDFARALLNQPEAGRLGGHRHTVAILMTDIRGFTALAERLSPEDTIEMLNGYFSTVIPLIRQHEGIIVDFVGDGILAFFEPGRAAPETAVRRAVRCAFDMQAAVANLSREMTARGLPSLETGIGINSGPVVVGNIGSESRKKYGIVGAAVNAAQRIQSQARGGEVVLPAAMFDAVRDSVVVERDFSVALKGIASPVRLVAASPKPDAPGTPEKDG